MRKTRTRRPSPLNALGSITAKGVFLLALCACGRDLENAGTTGSSTELAPKPATATVAAEPTPVVLTVSISPFVPQPLAAEALRAVRTDPGFAPADLGDAADVRVGPDPEAPISTWVYALVAPFPTVRDGIELEQLRFQWGNPDSETRFLASEDSAGAAIWLLGEPAEGRLEILPEEELLGEAWSGAPAMALVPFERLEPRWKVLAIDGVSPIHADFNATPYPLSISLGLSGDPGAVEQLGALIDWPESNRLEDRLSAVVMTGVTALVRATAWRMEVHGNGYPGEQIKDWLLEADVTHISNEVSFAEDCPPGDPYQSTLRFCSRPEYSQLLSGLGVDVVELTGNHLLDWGAASFLDTLALYDDLGIRVFAGGQDLERSQKPLLIEHNGNRIAFLGCNAAGPERVWATLESPGVAPCSEERVYAHLQEIAEGGALPIFTYQWKESKRAGPLSDQVEAFRRAIDEGALIVSGSQAHQPQTLEFYRGRLIHYGLGNLFFDQMENLANRREFIDRHVFYQGRHISTELLTAMLEDFAQPRPMSADERAAFLSEIFAQSGW